MFLKSTLGTSHQAILLWLLTLQIQIVDTQQNVAKRGKGKVIVQPGDHGRHRRTSNILTQAHLAIFLFQTQKRGDQEEKLFHQSSPYLSS